MRVTLSGLRDSLQSIFGKRADEIAAETGFVVRKRKITGASFLRTLVLGWLSKPDSTIEQLLDSSTESAEPVTAHEIITLRAMSRSLGLILGPSTKRPGSCWQFCPMGRL